MRRAQLLGRHFKRKDPGLDDEGVYLGARAIVGAEVQLITYGDYLPLLLGPNALPPTQDTTRRIIPVSATTLRWRHIAFVIPWCRPSCSGWMPTINILIGGYLPLGECFCRPDQVVAVRDDPYVRRLARSKAPGDRPLLINDLRNLLAGFIGRAQYSTRRDHGMPPFNQCRAGLRTSGINFIRRPDVRHQYPGKTRIGLRYG